jgi:uncharacterized OB-fold protein
LLKPACEIGLESANMGGTLRGFGSQPWNQLASWMKVGGDPDPAAFTASVTGFLVAIGLFAVRIRSVGFPLHPVGYGISSTWSMGTVWLPPRADCPDCFARMKWVKVKPEGKIYTFTMVDYAGIGVEMKTPYWQIDVEIPGVDTIFKGYLAHGKPEIGMPVKAEFRTQNPSHTILDIWWVPK